MFEFTVTIKNKSVESEVSKFVLHLGNKKGAKFLCFHKVVRTTGVFDCGYG